jgi:hypothetical protein
MKTFRWSSFGIVATSILLGTVAGCGGSGSANGIGLPPLPPTVPLNGGLAAVTVTSPTTVISNGSDQTILVTLPGQTQPSTVVIPGSESVAAGQSMAIIPANTTLIQNLTGGATRQGAAGDLTINGLPSTVTVVNGTVSENIGLVAGNYTFLVQGPFTAHGNGNALTIQEFEFIFESNGSVLSIPTTIAGQIPANNSDNWQNSITFTFDPSYGTGTAELDIQHANGTMDKTVTLQNNQATFAKLSNTENGEIPIGGVNLVKFNH